MLLALPALAALLLVALLEAAMRYAAPQLKIVLDATPLRSLCVIAAVMLSFGLFGDELGRQLLDGMTHLVEVANVR